MLRAAALRASAAAGGSGRPLRRARSLATLPGGLPMPPGYEPPGPGEPGHHGPALFEALKEASTKRDALNAKEPPPQLLRPDFKPVWTGPFWYDWEGSFQGVECPLYRRRVYEKVIDSCRLGTERAYVEKRALVGALAEAGGDEGGARRFLEGFIAAIELPPWWDESHTSAVMHMSETEEAFSYMKTPTVKNMRKRWKGVDWDVLNAIAGRGLRRGLLVDTVAKLWGEDMCNEMRVKEVEGASPLLDTDTAPWWGNSCEAAPWELYERLVDIVRLSVDDAYSQHGNCIGSYADHAYSQRKFLPGTEFNPDEDPDDDDEEDHPDPERPQRRKGDEGWMDDYERSMHASDDFEEKQKASEAAPFDDQKFAEANEAADAAAEAQRASEPPDDKDYSDEDGAVPLPEAKRTFGRDMSQEEFEAMSKDTDEHVASLSPGSDSLKGQYGTPDEFEVDREVGMYATAYFERFLVGAWDSVLPDWWDDHHSDNVRAIAFHKDSDFSLALAAEASDIRKTWGNKVIMKFRVVAEQALPPEEGSDEEAGDDAAWREKVRHNMKTTGNFPRPNPDEIQTNDLDDPDYTEDDTDDWGDELDEELKAIEKKGAESPDHVDYSSDYVEDDDEPDEDHTTVKEPRWARQEDTPLGDSAAAK